MTFRYWQMVSFAIIWAGRQQVLQSYNPDSVCVQFDDIKNLKVAELRDVLTKRQIIYVYHNQIDARGDKANTEDEVFHACEEPFRKSWT